MDPSGSDEVGNSTAALTPVTWTDTVGVSAVGNDLTKTAPQTQWNAGAVSVESLADDGFVEFTTGEATTDKLAGLSVGNGGQSYQDIDFAIRLAATGVASVWEGGVKRTGIGAYAAGDVFRVQAENGIVTYYKNGVLKYTSALAPTFPLLVDTALRTPAATIDDVVLESIDVWTSAVRVAADGNDLTKTGPDDLFNAGAVSIESIPGGEGYAEFRVADATTVKAAGLSNGNSNPSRDDIDFALSLSDIGKVSVYEAGTRIGTFGDYAAGDRFQVGVSGGAVTYYRNWVPLYTSLASPTFPLLLDTSLRTPGAQILDGRVVVGSPVAECAMFQGSLPGGLTQGGAMDAAGDVMVVSYREATPAVAEVYRQTAGGWTLEQTLERPSGTTDPRFAHLATDGQTIAWRLQTDVWVGVIQVYRFDGAEWIPDGLLEACPGSSYGFSFVDVQGELLVAGVNGEVHVFRRLGGLWILEAILTNADGNSGAQAAVGGDRIFVMARDNDALYVFRHNPALPDPPQPPSCSNIDPGKWRQREKFLFPPEPHRFRNVEIAASPDGKRVLVGDSEIDAHLFTFASGDWIETILDPYPGGDGAHVEFGGPGDDSVVITSGNVGTAVFVELAGGWTQIATYDAASNQVAASDDSVFNLSFDDDQVDVYGINPVCLPD